MAWQVTVSSLVAFGSAALSLLVAGAVYRYRSQPGARPLVALMFALVGWSFVYAVQLGFTTRADQLLWQRVALAIGGTVPLFWLLFTVTYAGKDEWLTRRRLAALALEPAAFALVVLTNPVHNLVWSRATLTPVGSSQAVLLSFGVGYFVHIAYAYLLVAGGLGVLAVLLTEVSTLYRKQTVVLIAGVIPPFLANVAFTLRVPWGPMPALDLTPFAFVISGVLFSVALYRFDLLERAPIARQQVLNEMGDGLVVLDPDGVVLDANPVARTLLDPTPTVGTSIEAVVSEETASPEAAIDAIRNRTITATVDGQQRAYDTQRSSLTDHHDRSVGNVLVFRDISERYEHEKRLEVTHRVLRHNLRNQMNVVRGSAEYIVEDGSGATESASRIIDTADDLIDLSEKTRQLIAMDDYDRSGSRRVDVGDALTAIADEFRRRHPEATISCAVPSDLQTALPDEKLLAVAVRNLVENAIEHNDADEPWVELRAAQTADGAVVRVGDDGPGIPPVERDVLEAGFESQLKHGSGVGLWLTYWSTRQMGGDISFATRTPRGSVVTLELPGAENGVSTDARE